MDIKMLSFIVFLIGGICLYLYFLAKRLKTKLSNLKKSFLFSVDELKNAIIIAVSVNGDNQKLDEWIKKYSDRLSDAACDFQLTERWYVLTRNALSNRVRAHFNRAKGMIEEGDYHSAICALQRSNREVLQQVRIRN